MANIFEKMGGPGGGIIGRVPGIDSPLVGRLTKKLRKIKTKKGKEKSRKVLKREIGKELIGERLSKEKGGGAVWSPILFKKGKTLP